MMREEIFKDQTPEKVFEYAQEQVVDAVVEESKPSSHL